jgi:hypothetical protein
MHTCVEDHDVAGREQCIKVVYRECVHHLVEPLGSKDMLTLVGVPERLRKGHPVSRHESIRCTSFANTWYGTGCASWLATVCITAITAPCDLLSSVFGVASTQSETAKKGC